MKDLHHNRTGPLPMALLVLSATILVTVGLGGLGGCGQGDEDAPEAQLIYADLDSPGLADLEFGDVKPGVPVLCYHYFRGGFDPGYLMRVLGSVLFGMPALGPREFWTTPSGEFERHLKYFQETGTEVLTLDEVANHLASGEPLPARAVVLTIDDADISVYEHAYPLLRKYGLRAHLFVPTGEVGRPWSSLDVCTWEQLQEMSDSGAILIGSHTRQLHFKIKTSRNPEPVFWHADAVPVEIRMDNDLFLQRHGLGVRTPAELEQLQDLLAGPYGPVAADLLVSRLEIEAGAGATPHWLAWPYGFGTAELDSICGIIGFTGTVSLRPDTYGPDDEPGHVGRFTLTAKSSIDRIARVFPVPES